MTWTEIDAACIGYETRIAREKELDRFIASILINANRKRGTKAVRPEEIIPLITDRRRRGPVELITRDEYERAKELMKKAVWQTQN